MSYLLPTGTQNPTSESAFPCARKLWFRVHRLRDLGLPDGTSGVFHPHAWTPGRVVEVFCDPSRRHCRPVAPGLWIASERVLLEQGALDWFQQVFDLRRQRGRRGWGRVKVVYPRGPGGLWSLTDLERILRAARKVLRKGGEVLLVTEDPPHFGWQVAAGLLLVLGEACDVAHAMEAVLPANAGIPEHVSATLDLWWKSRGRGMADPPAVPFHQRVRPNLLRCKEEALSARAARAYENGTMEPPQNGVVGQNRGTGSKLFSLNGIALYHREDQDELNRAASTEIQVDLDSLGVQVLRQHGARNLMWGHLISQMRPDTVSSVDFLVRETSLKSYLGMAAAIGDIRTWDFYRSVWGWVGVPETTEEIWSLIVTPTNIERYAELLHESYRHGKKLVFTFLSIGGGGWVIDDGGVLDPWATDDDQEYYFDNVPCLPFEGTGSNPLWHRFALDPRNENKSLRIQALAWATAWLLNEAERRVQGDHGVEGVLSKVVFALELFNEMDVRNVVTNKDSERHSSGKSAFWWGDLYTRCALEFADSLIHGSRSGETGWRPRILLPGLASWSTEVADPEYNCKSRSYKFSFLDHLLTRISDVFDGYHSRGEFPGVGLEDLVGGIDLHEYHRPWVDDRNRKHEYASTTDVMEDVEQALGILDDHGFPDTVVTVMESGVSAGWASKTDAHDDPVYVDSPPDLFVSGFDGRLRVEEYQARELLRRVCTSLCSEAEAGGWHSWKSEENQPKTVSSGEATFYGMGLRTDNANTRVWWQVRSWFMYQRLVDVLCPVKRGSLRYPTHHIGSGSEDARDFVLVFELESSDTRLPYYFYVVCLDPGFYYFNDPVPDARVLIISTEPIRVFGTSVEILHTPERAEGDGSLPFLRSSGYRFPAPDHVHLHGSCSAEVSFSEGVGANPHSPVIIRASSRCDIRVG